MFLGSFTSALFSICRSLNIVLFGSFSTPALCALLSALVYPFPICPSFASSTSTSLPGAHGVGESVSLFLHSWVWPVRSPDHSVLFSVISNPSLWFLQFVPSRPSAAHHHTTRLNPFRQVWDTSSPRILHCIIMYNTSLPPPIGLNPCSMRLGNAIDYRFPASARLNARPLSPSHSMRCQTPFYPTIDLPNSLPAPKKPCPSMQTHPTLLSCEGNGPSSRLILVPNVRASRGPWKVITARDAREGSHLQMTLGAGGGGGGVFTNVVPIVRPCPADDSKYVHTPSPLPDHISSGGSEGVRCRERCVAAWFKVMACRPHHPPLHCATVGCLSRAEIRGVYIHRSCRVWVFLLGLVLVSTWPCMASRSVDRNPVWRGMEEDITMCSMAVGLGRYYSVMMVSSCQLLLGSFAVEARIGRAGVDGWTFMLASSIIAPGDSPGVIWAEQPHSISRPPVMMQSGKCVLDDRPACPWRYYARICIINKTPSLILIMTAGVSSLGSYRQSCIRYHPQTV